MLDSAPYVMQISRMVNNMAIDCTLVPITLVSVRIGSCMTFLVLLESWITFKESPVTWLLGRFGTSFWGLKLDQSLSTNLKYYLILSSVLDPIFFQITGSNQRVRVFVSI